MKNLNLLIRGHIRNSFDDDKFINLIRAFSESYKLDIFIHTWNIVQNNISWRHVPEIKNDVSEEHIRLYFKEFEKNIKSIQIDDDSKIEHRGNTSGNIGFTPCPVLAWKNMYYGKMRLVDRVAEKVNGNEVAVQTRFDLLSNSFSPEVHDVIRFLKENYDSIAEGDNQEKLRFIWMHPFIGIDNIYMASIRNMQKFVRYMYFDMDRILEFHKETRHQEHISFHERFSPFINTHHSLGE